MFKHLFEHQDLIISCGISPELIILILICRNIIIPIPGFVLTCTSSYSTQDQNLNELPRVCPTNCDQYNVDENMLTDFFLFS